MSGCGRKHRAKHVTQQFLDESEWNGFAQPGNYLARCVSASVGNNCMMVEPLLAKGTAPPSGIDSSGQVRATLARKLYKVTWILVGDVLEITEEAIITRKLSPSQAQSALAGMGLAHSLSAPEVPVAVALGEEDSDTNSLDGMVNLNRNNLRHRQYEEEVDSDEEEEEEEAEEA